MQTRVCGECGASFDQLRGPPASKCRDCRRPQKPSEVGRSITPENLERKQAARDAKREHDAANVFAKPMRDAMRLAWGLSMFPDPALAAMAVRVELAGAELEAAAKLAREAFPGLVRGDSAELAKIAGLGQHLAMCEALDSLGRVPPQNLPFAVGGFGKARTDLAPQAPDTYAPITLQFVLPAGFAVPPALAAQVVTAPAEAPTKT